MKTRELIRQLHEADPTGEREVAVENTDIHFVSIEPAYYDGCLQVLKRDESKTDCYNIVGAEFRAYGDKVVIHTLSVRWAITNDPNIPITYDSDFAREHYGKSTEDWRAEVKSWSTKKRREQKKE